MSPLTKAGPPIVLSIAGYDPSSGAGITADIKTIAAHGCYAVTCITALTVQSTQGVRRVEPVNTRTFTETLEELMADFTLAAVKIGMLGSAEIARATAAFLRGHHLRNVVLDPVLVSSSGKELISGEGQQILKEELLLLADVITPNIDEAAALAGVAVRDIAGMKKAAGALHKIGAQNVVITGGHLDPPVDLLSLRAGQEQKLFEGKKIGGRSTHGTGCAFSSAVACNLALGHDLVRSTKAAKQYVTMALKKAVPIGKGRGPVNHLAQLIERIKS